eukprot:TRINITY_DN3333_c0_g1_i3.p1 TRINITY_DN3333_c0_g1~~TRINITY_DN3333_c0_g1_i3.p1  ORF type:complete len:779 (-),score=169.29 TRINITY_DN3333_c0_g1_i3:15-2351(-)
MSSDEDSIFDDISFFGDDQAIEKQKQTERKQQRKGLKDAIEEFQKRYDEIMKENAELLEKVSLLEQKRARIAELEKEKREEEERRIEEAKRKQKEDEEREKAQKAYELKAAEEAKNKIEVERAQEEIDLGTNVLPESLESKALPKPPKPKVSQKKTAHPPPGSLMKRKSSTDITLGTQRDSQRATQNMMLARRKLERKRRKTVAKRKRASKCRNPNKKPPTQTYLTARSAQLFNLMAEGASAVIPDIPADPVSTPQSTAPAGRERRQSIAFFNLMGQGADTVIKDLDDDSDEESEELLNQWREQQKVEEIASEAQISPKRVDNGGTKSSKPKGRKKKKKKDPKKPKANGGSVPSERTAIKRAMFDDSSTSDLTGMTVALTSNSTANDLCNKAQLKLGYAVALWYHLVSENNPEPNMKKVRSKQNPFELLEKYGDDDVVITFKPKKKSVYLDVIIKGILNMPEYIDNKQYFYLRAKSGNRRFKSPNQKYTPGKMALLDAFLTYVEREGYIKDLELKLFVSSSSRTSKNKDELLGVFNLDLGTVQPGKLHEIPLSTKPDAPIISFSVDKVYKSTDGLFKQHGYPIPSLPLRLQVGDMILFSQSSVTSMGTKLVSMSKWDHAAIVIPSRNPNNVDKQNAQCMSLFEATRDGVKSYPLSLRLKFYLETTKLGIRKLYGNKSPMMISKLVDFVTEVEGRAYKKNPLELTKLLFSGNSKDNQKDLFCSQLVAAAYQRMELMPSDIPANNFLPSNLADSDMPWNHKKLMIGDVITIPKTHNVKHK